MFNKFIFSLAIPLCFPLCFLGSASLNICGSDMVVDINENINIVDQHTNNQGDCFELISECINEGFENVEYENFISNEFNNNLVNNLITNFDLEILKNNYANIVNIFAIDAYYLYFGKDTNKVCDFFDSLLRSKLFG